jgi:acetylornithine deacetylase
LFGPGTIHVAHTLDERVPKRQLLDAVEIYQKMIIQLQRQAS